jgi:hypothetical protein
MPSENPFSDESNLALRLYSEIQEADSVLRSIFRLAAADLRNSGLDENVTDRSGRNRLISEILGCGLISANT